MLECANLTASYRGFTALNDVSVAFGKGERVGVFGHNGAGKTTLLRCAVGAVTEVRGRVRFAGADIVPGEVHRNTRLGMGFVPQGHNVFRDLSVRQNLRIAGLLHDPAYAAEVLRLFPVLDERGEQLAGSLSGGEQQMLALGMALMTQPAMLLLDEPATGLAPVIVRNVLDTLQRLNAERGIALVIVEQNVQATLAVVDRAVVLKGGRVVFDAPAPELRSRRDLWELF